VASQPLLVEDLEPGELPDAIDRRDLQLGLVAVASLVDVAAPPAQKAPIPTETAAAAAKAAARLSTRDL